LHVYLYINLEFEWNTYWLVSQNVNWSQLYIEKWNWL